MRKNSGLKINLTCYSLEKCIIKPSLVVHLCNPSAGEAEEEHEFKLELHREILKKKKKRLPDSHKVL
jgi:hypothetical protein